MLTRLSFLAPHVKGFLGALAAVILWVVLSHLWVDHVMWHQLIDQIQANNVRTAAQQGMTPSVTAKSPEAK